MNALIAAGLAALAALGLTMAVAGWVSPPARTKSPRRGLLAMLTAADRRNLAIGLVLGAIIALTGWLVALVIVPVAALLLPRLMRGPEQVDPDRLAAMEEWTRALSGVLSGNLGMATAIRETRGSLPEPIRPELERLIARIQARRPLVEALYALADDLNDQTGDFIASALIGAANASGAGLQRTLADIAADVAEEVRMRREIATQRRATMLQVRGVTVMIVLSVGGFVFFTPTGQFYRSGVGQLILMGLCAAFGATLLWVRSAGTTRPAARFLQSPIVRESEVAR